MARHKRRRSKKSCKIPKAKLRSIQRKCGKKMRGKGSVKARGRRMGACVKKHVRAAKGLGCMK